MIYVKKRIIIEGVSNRNERVWLVNNILYISDGIIIKPIINKRGNM